MNTQAVRALPSESIPSLPRSFDPVPGSSFPALLASASTSTSSATDHSTSQTSAAPAPKTGDDTKSSSDARDSGREQPRKSHGGTSAVVIPLPVPMLLSFQPPQPVTNGTVTNGTATPGSAVAPGLPGATAPQDALHQPVAGFGPIILPAAIVTANAAAPAAGAAAQPTAGTQPLPTVAAALGARIASGATQLVSQPRVALASLAPDAGQSAGARNAVAQGDAASTPHLPDAADLQHVLAKPPVPVAPQSADQILATVGKEVGAPMPLGDHIPAASRAETATNANNGNDATTTAAQLAAMATPVNAAPSNAAAPAPSIAMVPHSVAEQVAVNLRQAVSSGADRIEIQLQPADLGAISVKLNVNHDGRVTMVVSADRSDTLNLLQQDAGSLAQALRDAGLQTDSGSLSFNLRGGYQFNQQASAHGGSGLAEATPTGISADGATAAAITPAPRLHAGSLDIQV